MLARSKMMVKTGRGPVLGIHFKGLNAPLLGAPDSVFSVHNDMFKLPGLKKHVLGGNWNIV